MILPFFHLQSQLLNNTWIQAGQNSTQWIQRNQAGHDGKGIEVQDTFIKHTSSEVSQLKKKN